MTPLLLLILLFGQAKEAKDIPYRLLTSKIPASSDRLKEATFIVSVERSISRAEAERLICQILAKEQPPKFEKLNIQVFINTDIAENQLAWYTWDSKLPRIRGRLVVAKDADGNPFDQLQSREFNHEKTCRATH